MKNYLFLLMLLLPFSSIAQDSNFGNWIIYFGNKKIDNKWNWHHEVQYRNYNAIGDLEQLLLRTGFGYNLTENNNNLLLGYGYILSENYIANTDEKNSINEHRIYQQFITRQKIARVGVQHRYRFEQRFVEDDFKLRFRYFLGLNVPLNNAELIEKTIYLSAYNEIFLNTKNTVFDRNRLYSGLGYKLNNSLKFEIGYMNQFLAGGNNRDQLNLITSFNF
ncbi:MULTISPECIES: DUF2490 domain-containing protein [Aequorivita]|uniref:DUF2490 domain-containing protein n=1 Tax=Aequorivita iocasae TaxID=2803865 RepID=A0ABX7DSD7_9FLAO|nr:MULTISPECIES: DUF2490 domain-containing protein [Aequorivita]QQX76735.1 DUF2490 domain-containing protein [Aequorivita iocasae]UCA56207.1 DUF2490 domain-containing protein [Aequorivita sp. F7]